MPEPPGVRATVFPVVGRLRFADDLEPSFTQHRLEQSLPFARFALVLALRLREDAGLLTFDVVDDGKGFDAQARGLGAGFLNMADRLGALGGSLRVESAPRRGTTVSGTIPANADVDAG
jgi:glucose-6-phosphate-specific signal transduction histidine kinase